MASLYQLPVDIKGLETVVSKHGFVPALCPPMNEPQCDLLWDGLTSLCLVDAKMGYFLAKHAGSSILVSNLALMKRLFKHPDLSLASLEDALEAGFELTDAVIIAILSWDDIVLLGNCACEILSKLIARKRLQDCLLITLRRFFESNTKRAIHIIDYLIDKFSVSEEIVSSAFILKKSFPKNVLLTRFGQAHGGMSDALWSFMVAKYGIEHAFVEACLSDLIVGGYVCLDSMQKADGSDDAASDSLNALVGLGLPFRPAVFSVVSSCILKSRVIPKRMLEYLTLLEISLLKSPTSQWVDCFTLFLEAPQVTSLEVSHGLLGSIGDSLKHMGRVRRFISCTRNLCTFMADSLDNDDISALSIQEKDSFGVWLIEPTSKSWFK